MCLALSVRQAPQHSCARSSAFGVCTGFSSSFCLPFFSYAFDLPVGTICVHFGRQPYLLRLPGFPSAAVNSETDKALGGRHDDQEKIVHSRNGKKQHNVQMLLGQNFPRVVSPPTGIRTLSQEQWWYFVLESSTCWCCSCPTDHCRFHDTKWHLLSQFSEFPDSNVLFWNTCKLKLPMAFFQLFRDTVGTVSSRQTCRKAISGKIPCNLTT